MHLEHFRRLGKILVIARGIGFLGKEVSKKAYQGIKSRSAGAAEAEKTGARLEEYSLAHGSFGVSLTSEGFSTCVFHAKHCNARCCMPRELIENGPVYTPLRRNKTYRCAWKSSIGDQWCHQDQRTRGITERTA